MKILVTGAGGFIGSHMVNYLKRKGHWVRGVDVKKSEYMGTHEDSWAALDLRDFENCLHSTEDVNQVYHFAANMGGIGFITKIKADVMHDNVLINASMLRTCVENNVKRFLFASSACIYPKSLQLKPAVRPLKESDAFPAHPDSAYGWEKLFTEIMSKAYTEDYGLEVRIARYHNIYGPYGTYKGGREKAPAAICRKVAEAENEKTITIWGDGEQTRSFFYIDDCLEFTYRLMNSEYIDPLNIGSDQSISIDQLADMIIEISGKSLRKKYDLSKPQGVRGRNADLTLAKEALDWKPKVSYREGLEELYKWVEKMVSHDCRV